jgi:hypothetical protein
MTKATDRHPTSISAMLDAAAAAPGAFHCAPTVAPWETPPSDPNPPAESELLTVAQAADVVPLSTKQLYRVAKIAGGPFRKIEGRWMAYAADLHRWIREHPTGEPDTSAAASTSDTLADRVRRRRERGEAS